VSESFLSDILGADLSSAAYDALLASPGVLFPFLGNDPHETDLIDEYDQFRRLFASAISYLPRAFIDSTDSGLQFSVKAGQWQDESGTWRSVALRNNVSTTNAVANYVYYPSTASTSSDLVVNTTGFPTTPHIRVAVITPANSSLIPDHIDDRLSMNLLRPIGGTTGVSQANVMTSLVFDYTDVAAGLTSVAMNIGGSAAGLVCRKAGFFVGMSAVVDEARTADTLTIKPGLSSTPGGAFAAISATGLNLTINGASTYQNYASIAYGTSGYAIAAGDRVCPLITTGGSWTPITADLTVIIDVIFSP